MTYFFVVKTARGFERKVALDLEMTARLDKHDLKAILVTPDLTGFIVVECERRVELIRALRGISRAKGVLGGKMTGEEAMRYLEIPEEQYKSGEVIEVIAGPFKGFQASVIEDDGGSKVTVMLLEWQHAGRVILGKDQVRR